MKRLMIAVAALALTGGGCATAIGSGDSGRSTSPEPQPGARASGDLLPGLRGLSDPFPSTYRPLPTEDLAIVGATVLTGSGQKSRTASWS